MLPKKQFDYQKWAVIACDQFTSQPAYWQTLDAMCGDISTLRLIFPEYYLSVMDDAAVDAKIEDIHRTMRRYLNRQVFDAVDDFVLVERSLPTGGVRVGLMIAIDLEQYDYHLGNTAAIRATEATVESRLPIRVRIRNGAPLELSHALALVDDQSHGVIETLYDAKDTMPLLYDVELSMGGGHLRGYRVTDSATVLMRLRQLLGDRQFQLAVGDGNHSIAAAKAYWLQLRASLTPQQAQNHPARYCTCELVNLNSDGLTFHPIHRVVYNVDFEGFLSALRGYMQGDGALSLVYEGRWYSVSCPVDATQTIESMAAFLSEYCAQYTQTKVDYIHGEGHLRKVAEDLHGVGVVMPSMPKNALFPYVEQKGILPKKAFSLGEAEEKRYYMEAKSIE